MPADNQTVSWPGWEVVRTVGAGSFGTVYEIRRELFGKRKSAAMKVISVPADDSEIAEPRYEDAGFDPDYYVE